MGWAVARSEYPLGSERAEGALVHTGRDKFRRMARQVRAKSAPGPRQVWGKARYAADMDKYAEGSDRRGLHEARCTARGNRAQGAGAGLA